MAVFGSIGRRFQIVIQGLYFQKMKTTREQHLFNYSKRRKSIVRPIIKAQERLDRLSKKRSFKDGSTEATSPDSQKTGSMTGSMTTSSEQVLPSPTKMRARKTRHRRSNSRGSLNTASPIKSPSNNSLQEEREIKSTVLRFADHHKESTAMSSFKYMGPGTAIREQKNEEEASNDKPTNQNLKEKNLNDVCFGCDGGCSDATCSSKRSSQVSADTESNLNDSPGTSPFHSCNKDLIVNSLHQATYYQNFHGQNHIYPEKDSNENISCSLDEVLNKLTTLPLTVENVEKTGKNEHNNSLRRLSMKRTISDVDISCDHLNEHPPPQFTTLNHTHTNHNSTYSNSKHCEDSLSEEEFEVSEDDKHPNHLSNSYSDNNSDKLSEKELAVRRMQNQVTNTPDSIFKPPLDSSSEPEECCDEAVHSRRNQTFDSNDN
ncbi:hypothetical protein LOTGIDRAFT_238473 [Lottia gigantea]|uniref:Uncharacterized protein n=1 Tax=Lottia gigantea TaxID=225164 RepID=V4AA47_LOTGI|nr:hypothetical protein LOTGIDRAFT_238473 [Lottia gigantea]ESP00834.1 hypothetical protein LOTGIDRAFT_238473 [Lottia gigantea]